MKIQCSVVFWQKYFRNQELFNILLNNLRFIDSTIVSNKFGRHLLPVFLQTSFQIVPLILTRRSIFSNFRHTCSIVIWVRERERERERRQRDWAISVTKWKRNFPRVVTRRLRNFPKFEYAKLPAAGNFQLLIIARLSFIRDAW